MAQLNRAETLLMEKNLNKEYRERYRLLNIKNGFPPYEAFDRATLPYNGKGPSGEDVVVYEKSLALNRDWSRKFWLDKAKILSKKEREDYQVVIIPPRKRKEENKQGDFTNPDFTESFYESLKKKPLGKNPVSKFERGDVYQGNDIERTETIKDQRTVKTVFIVASPLDGFDLKEISNVASQYKRMGAKEVILVAPFLPDEREDKNVGKTISGKRPKYNKRIMKIDGNMQILSGFVDRILTYETHSSATQAFAAIHGIALAPLSLEEELIGYKVKGEFLKLDKDRYRFVRPDQGRNLVATRIEQTLGIKGIHLSQIRNSKSLKKDVIGRLTKDEKNELQGRKILLYDDEAGTFKTITNVVVDYVLPAQPESIDIFLGHARLQDGWKENLLKIIKAAKAKKVSIRIFVTNSRVPIGDIVQFNKKNGNLLKIVDISDKNRLVIEATVDGVDFWRETNYKQHINFERQILQFIPGTDIKSPDDDN